jgi:hypothetical protein
MMDNHIHKLKITDEFGAGRKDKNLLCGNYPIEI